MEVISVEKSKPGYVSFKQVAGKPKLDDLWFFTGSRCNLACKHCYVGSSPTNDSLQMLSLSDVKPFLREAKEFGVEHIYFTGGEPFINPNIISILSEALEVAQVTVLTNATYPIRRFMEQLGGLQAKDGHALSFRVSLDHYVEAKHDAVRGKGMFRLTVENVNTLFSHGFTPIITSTAVVYEGNSLTEKEIEERFKELFRREGVEVEVKLLPYNLEMGTNLTRIKKPSKHVLITEDCMKKPGIHEGMFQCHNGRTVQKINNAMVVYPCPIIYDDRAYELSGNLKDSFTDVRLTHKACFDFCYKSGGKCTN